MELKYVKINIPIEVAKRIEPFLRDSGGQYRSYSEFVVEAVRLRLEQLGVAASKAKEAAVE